MNANRKWVFHLLLCYMLMSVSFDTSAQYDATRSGNQTVFLLEGTIRLDSLTKYIHRMSAIRISFNSSRLNKSTSIFFPKARYTADQLLKHIRKHTSLDFTEFRGYFIFSDKIKKPDEKKTEIKVKHLPVAQKKTEVTKVSSHLSGKPPASNTQQLKPISSPVPIEKVVLSSPILPQLLPQKTQPAISVSDSILGSSMTAITPPLMTQQQKQPDMRTTSSASKSGSKERKRLSITLPNLLPDLSGFSLGLQWNADLPLYGTTLYFGIDNKALFKQIIPTIWVGKQWNSQHEFYLQASLFSRYFTGRETFSDPTNPKPGDDTLTKKNSATLISTSGSSVALQYNYRFASAWSAGIGLQYNTTRTVLMQTDNSAKEEKRSKSLYAQYFRPGFFVGKVELAYEWNKIQVGIAALLPVTPVASRDDKKVKPLNMQLVLRWRIFAQQ